MNLKVSVIVPAYNAEHMVSASKHDVVTASSIPDILGIGVRYTKVELKVS